jgi:hypothetical protein
MSDSENIPPPADNLPVGTSDDVETESSDSHPLRLPNSKPILDIEPGDIYVCELINLYKKYKKYNSDLKDKPFEITFGSKFSQNTQNELNKYEASISYYIPEEGPKQGELVILYPVQYDNADVFSHLCDKDFVIFIKDFGSISASMYQKDYSTPTIDDVKQLAQDRRYDDISYKVKKLTETYKKKKLTETYEESDSETETINKKSLGLRIYSDLEIYKPDQIPGDTDKPVQIPVDTDKPVQIPVDTDKPVQIPVDTDKPVQIYTAEIRYSDPKSENFIQGKIYFFFYPYKLWYFDKKKTSPYFLCDILIEDVGTIIIDFKKIFTKGGKRKTNKRKTNKRKTNKRKTNKRKTNKRRHHR